MYTQQNLSVFLGDSSFYFDVFLIIMTDVVVYHICNILSFSINSKVKLD